MLSELAASLETIGWKSRASAAREGWPATSRPDMRFFDGAHAQFRYRERGAGPAIVFLADPPVTLEMYDELLALYASRFRVFVAEVPAMGFTIAKGGADFSFDGSTAAIQDFVENIVAAPATLAFSCAAGLAGVAIAARRPELVERLVLIQTPSWDGMIGWKKARDPKKILAKPFIGHWAMNRLKKTRAPAWFKIALGRRDRMDSFCACAQETLDRGAGWGLATAYQLFLTERRPNLPSISQPILAIWGSADRSHAGTNPESSREHGADIRHVIYDDLGHFPELEDPARVFAAIAAFVDETR